ncbi:hypothetical protein JQC72_07920 [Polycladomyces sp. WAk]|uniref:Uncharacterized protein n=1 Tax=Polycladomyces zharkentensis TaxID=2807616 RepID=A0ABS2WIR7_9BACL|nr:hypothetical protein [Polycladomyces sp. WAk]MBN2909452.1 hypothetical protein [Polycladomyces sp. WAk]
MFTPSSIHQGILDVRPFKLVQEETPNTLNSVSGLRVNPCTHTMNLKIIISKWSHY